MTRRAKRKEKSGASDADLATSRATESTAPAVENWTLAQVDLGSCARFRDNGRPWHISETLRLTPGKLAMTTRLFFSVGEPSGDLHGANLIRELRKAHPDIACVGFGGPLMEQAGCELQADLTAFAVMWIAQVLTRLHQFIGLLFQANRLFRDKRPDAVVLIDYPGFNWWVARRAKAHGIPVLYYGTPQMWAWAPWRIKKLKRLVDHVLCKLPFEAEWFQSRGCQAIYVGHPYFDELATRRLDTAFLDEVARIDGPLVTLLPGSRDQEVAAHLPSFFRSVANMQTDPDAPTNLHFAVACFSPAHAQTARQLLDKAGLPSPEQVRIHVHRTPELVEGATACIACSGSVSLELLYHTKPSLILYQVSRFAFRLQDQFRTARYITLVNLLATEDIARRPGQHYDPEDPDCEVVPMPEYLTFQDRSHDLAKRMLQLLNNPDHREEVANRLQSLRERFGQPGASQRAARHILELVLKNQRPAPHSVRPVASRPHNLSSTP